jgi:hypothetical protein
MFKKIFDFIKFLIGIIIITVCAIYVITAAIGIVFVFVVIAIVLSIFVFLSWLFSKL